MYLAIDKHNVGLEVVGVSIALVTNVRSRELNAC
jgi:hypothetical protein